jgi:hypothetical protein
LFNGHPNANGEFSIPVTVNPDEDTSGLSNGLTLDRNTTCIVCHAAVSQLSLTPGPLRIRVTVTASSGQQAYSERRITVDRGGYAVVPVKVVLAEDGRTPAVNVLVTGGARLYMWRSRYGTAFTDNEGIAAVRVEALSEAPTHYIFQVEPIVVDGILYQSVEPVEETLPPGATTAGQITLQVSTSRGQISGHISGLKEQVQIWAISLPNGSVNVAEVSPQGTFSFSDIGIDRYLLTADPQALAEQGLALTPENIDLSQAPLKQVDLNPQPQKGASIVGEITDETGAVLPFAWVSLGTQIEQTDPVSGAYACFGLPPDKTTVIISAPGYYSQAHVVNPISDSGTPLNISLVRRPETQLIPWGNGSIVISPETIAAVEGQNVIFEQGWLWGTGTSQQSLVINFEDTQILIPDGGKFALERLPAQSGWLYMMEGQANIVRVSAAGSILVKAGEMVNLSPDNEPQPVPYDPVVVRALRGKGEMPILNIWQATLAAQLRDRLARIGIGSAQVVTFIANIMEVLALLAIPFLGVNWVIRKKKSEKKRD